MPSRLFIYYNERAQEGDVSKDAGAFTGDGVKGMHNTGVVSESDWPYIPQKFATRPPDELYDAAAQNTVTSFKQIIQDENQIKQALYQGYPVLFSADIFPGFEGAEVGKTGMVPMPQAGEKSVGGHAMMIVGFDDEQQLFIVRNSWGPDWGDNGYCYFPYAYVLDKTYTSQFWVLLGVSD
jgi:C1A family cysteine protease